MALPRPRAALVAAALAATAVVLAGCVALPPGADPDMPCGAVGVAPLARCSVEPALRIDRAIVTQQQALPGFDGGPYVVDDAAMLDELEATLGGSGARDQTLGDSCPGSRSTTIDVTDASTGAFTIQLGACTDDPLVAELDALVAEWIASGTLQPAP
ncbi:MULTISPECIES: hypothetical protein [unclassified Agrococcus]|uniref:hypothetical protein n=1 Tax=unclassified Agrococcus TaxID=2615065 RepID=UPI0036122736